MSERPTKEELEEMYRNGMSFGEEQQLYSYNELTDKKRKYNILHEMFLELSKESLLDIYEILNGYKERINKSKKDTLLARCMFASGYHNTKEVQELLNVSKDTAEIKALSNDVFNIKILNKLRQTFDIDDNTFVKIVKEIEDDML